MVYKCCVPYCKGNYYVSEPRVHVFSFPKCEILRKKWIQAIKRNNFEPTKHSKVCNFHFNPEDIETATHYDDVKTGTSISFPLKFPRLRKNAVPSKIPGAPSSSSSSASSRKTAKKQRRKIKYEHLKKVSTENLKAKELEDSKRNVDETELDTKWTIITEPSTTMVGNFVEQQNLLIDANPDFDLSAVKVEIDSEEECNEEPNQLSTQRIDLSDYRTSPAPEKQRLKTSKPVSVDGIEDLNDSAGKNDEFFFFGKNVVSQLRQLPLHRALSCQYEISKLLRQQRVRTMSVPYPTVDNLDEEASS